MATLSDDFWKAIGDVSRLSPTARRGLTHAREHFVHERPFSAPERTAYYRIAKLRTELEACMSGDVRRCENCGAELPSASTKRRRYCPSGTRCYTRRRSEER